MESSGEIILSLVVIGGEVGKGGGDEDKGTEENG